MKTILFFISLFVVTQSNAQGSNQSEVLVDSLSENRIVIEGEQYRSVIYYLSLHSDHYLRPDNNLTDDITEAIQKFDSKCQALRVLGLSTGERYVHTGYKTSVVDFYQMPGQNDEGRYKASCTLR